MSEENILLIIADGLRRDMVSYYSNRDTTPFLDKLANRGIVFKNAFSTTDHTDPSFTSILSGDYPLSTFITRHGSREHGVKEDNIKKYHKIITPFQEQLQQQGYKTLAIDWLGRWHKRSFDFYGETLEGEMDTRDASQYLEVAKTLIEQNKDNKFFMLFHNWDTHTPFETLTREVTNKFVTREGNTPVEEAVKGLSSKWQEIALNYHLDNIEYKEQIIQYYEAAARQFDNQLKQTLTHLGLANALEDSLIIITADHGDNIFRHGKYVGHFGLYDDVIRVPLIIYNPKLESKEIRDYVQHNDLITIIKQLLEDREISIRDRDYIFTQSAACNERYSIRTKEYKLIYSPTTREALHSFNPTETPSNCEFYNLKHDSKEENNLIDWNNSKVQDLQEVLLETKDYLVTERNTELEKANIKSKLNKLKDRS